MHTEYNENFTKLLAFVSSNINSFEVISKRTPYCHMGATIADAILQAGLNYEYVVYPRIFKLLTNFKDYKTTCDFLILTNTYSLRELLDWNNEQKLHTINLLSWLLYENMVENEDQLANWLENYENIIKLSKIKGIGPKTIDYLKMLSGKPTVAVDRHLFKFLEYADVHVKTYDEAHILYCEVADELNIGRYELDKKIWSMMTKK